MNIKTLSSALLLSASALFAQTTEQEIGRQWKYEATVDINGKKGNSDEFASGFGFLAALEGQEDKLRVFASADFAESENVKTSEEYKGGVDYTSYFSDQLGYYLGIEGEKDDFENLDLRLLPKAGLSYKFFKEEDHSLEGRLGVAYRYEEFNDGTTEEGPGLNVGILHHYTISDWAKMRNELEYTPAFDDFGNYLLEHDTAIDLPLAISDFWKIRLGVSNTYNSEPAKGKEELDTTYYLKLLMTWE